MFPVCLIFQIARCHSTKERRATAESWMELDRQRLEAAGGGQARRFQGLLITYLQCSDLGGGGTTQTT